MGNQTMAAALPTTASYVEQLKQLVGQRVQDGDKYEFEILSNATFKIVVAPNDRGLGHVVEYGHPAWSVLCGLALMMCIEASVRQLDAALEPARRIAAKHGIDLALLVSLAGRRFTDGGGYELEVQTDGTFEITRTPDDDPRKRNAVIRATHPAWSTLAAIALTLTF